MKENRRTLFKLFESSTEHYSEKINPATSGKQTILLMTVFFFFQKRTNIYANQEAGT